jgi:hypothetical protein
VGLKETLIDTTKGAVHLAAVALSVAGSATQKVPYLGAISIVLMEVLKIVEVRSQAHEIPILPDLVPGGQCLQVGLEECWV